VIGAGFIAVISAALMAQPRSPAVTAKALRAAPAAEWLTYGRDQAETHYSPLSQISTATVAGLTRAWSTQLGVPGTLETTPLVSNGVLYATGPWSTVFALDARTGDMKWTWDPKLPTTGGPRLCCGAVNRGVALYNGLVFVGLLDGRLVALDADTGTPAWDVQTSVDLTESYSITGAPRVVKGKVIIGNGGAENAVRGYISAYDAMTGKLAWRFFTVPGDPSKAFEHPELAMAAKTWTGEWWKYGGGGTAWDAMAYDAEADLLYVGPQLPQPSGRRQPVPGVDPGAQARHRPAGVALPAGARRSVGLHHHAADDARRPSHRRPHAQGAAAGAEERLLLRDRSDHRALHLG
jgi:PQQ-dependent dehydrogenase (methanol/ethanol family)